MTLYMLGHDTNEGAREEWTFDGTPIEIFADAETRAARVAYLAKVAPSREAQTWETEFATDPERKGYEESEDHDFDEDD